MNIPLNNSLLKIENVYKSYGSAEILRGISIDIKSREVVVIIGISGTGKSTLLRCINLLTKPDQGRIWLENWEITADGADQNKVRQQIGMVFQDFNLFNHLSALGNVTIGLTKVLGMNKQKAIEKGMWELERVGLKDKVNLYPAQLSGGQKQRVAIARALGLEPKVMLFDEPTSALDPELIGEVLGVMQTLAEEGMTMVVVTHELGFAQDVADKIVFIENGKVVETGSPEQLFHNPQNARTKEFLMKITDLNKTSDEPVDSSKR